LLGKTASKRGWHGVTLRKAPATVHEVAVESVEEKSPAEAAGLKPGDVILCVGDIRVERPLDFYRALVEASPGEDLALSVRHGDATRSAELALAAPPARAKGPVNPMWEILGLELKPMAPQEFRERFHTEYRGGLTVAAVRPQGPAAEQGVRRGDVLVGMHIWETVSLENVQYIMNRADFANLSPVKFYILRGSETLYGFLPVGSVPSERK
jgi:serine protease Do